MAENMDIKMKILDPNMFDRKRSANQLHPYIDFIYGPEMMLDQYNRTFNRVVYGIDSWSSGYNKFDPRMKLSGLEKDVWEHTFGSRFEKPVPFYHPDSFQHASSSALSKFVTIGFSVEITKSIRERGHAETQYISMGRNYMYPIDTITKLEDILSILRHRIVMLNSECANESTAYLQYFASMIIFARRQDGSIVHYRNTLSQFAKKNSIMINKNTGRYTVKRLSDDAFNEKYGGKVWMYTKHTKYKTIAELM